MADFVLIDNSDKVLAELDSKIEAALEACGNQAVSHAKQNITSAGRVDTGALRGSINHLVQDKTCYIGTNQSYAIYHEMGTGIFAGGRQTPWVYKDAHGNWHRTRGVSPVHFLKNAAAGHVSEYVRIIKQFLKN